MVNLVNAWMAIDRTSGQAYIKALRSAKTGASREGCRVGIPNSVRLGKDLARPMGRMFRPHKVKSAVSGGPRNCAEDGI